AGGARGPGAEPRAGRAGARRREAEPRCRDGAQPGRAPALGPERQAEREPGPQPEPGPGRGSGPQGRAARSGGDRAPQWLRGFLPAPAGGWDPASPAAGDRGDPPAHPGFGEPQESGEGARIQRRASSPRGSAETPSVFRRRRPSPRHREDALFCLRPQTPTAGPPAGIAGTPSRDPGHHSSTPQDTKTQLHTPLNQGILLPPNSGTQTPQIQDPRTARDSSHQQEASATPLKARATEPSHLGP
ncbi:PREDICTED: translation initiation factor IF-2-like, partial [Chinchilla lanigera]|uniref:translation initiation factor IF-2-like n=1 Tax=Chinchilla lanigera TaxID=34839 RepID=UPI000698C4A5